MSNSPTSSSIPSPSSESSLPRLPVELLHKIIELSVPSHFYSATYRDRQFTLRHVCLTSRTFRRIAQPFLQQFDKVFLFDERIPIDHVYERASTARVLEVTVDRLMPAGSIETLILAYSQLRELHLYHQWKMPRIIDISQFPSLEHLTELSVYGADLTFMDPDAFPALRHLSLNECISNDDDILASLTFPSLKVPALLNTSFDIDPDEFDELLQQLDLLHCTPDTVSMEFFEDDVYEDKILLDCFFKDFHVRHDNLYEARHIRLRVHPDEIWDPEDAAKIREAFDTLLGIRRVSDAPLQTIFIDTELFDRLAPYEGLQQSYQDFIEARKMDGTEIVLEEQIYTYSADSAISPELLRWIDRRKKGTTEAEGQRVLGG